MRIAENKDTCSLLGKEDFDLRYVKQFLIIIVISFIGELCNQFIPLPIPASIYGLVILFVCLLTRVVKLEQVKDTGKFLIEIMPVMFIPPAVGLLESWGILKPIWIPVVGITLITTILVMVVSGKITQFVIRRDRKKREEEVEKP